MKEQAKEKLKNVEVREGNRKEDIVRRWNLIRRGIYHKNIQEEAKNTGSYSEEG